MKGAMGGFGLLIVGSMLGRPLPVHAQTQTSVKWADIVGTWEEIPALGTFKNGSSAVYRSLTFRPDGMVLWTEVFWETGDTLSESRWSGPFRTDTIEVMSWPAVIRLQDQRLSLKYLQRDFATEAGAQAYQRIDLSKRPLRQVIATGFGSAYLIPAHPPTPTGTLADLAGAWEGIPTPEWGEQSIIRRLRLFRSDSTILNVEMRQNGNDTLVSAGVYGGWWAWTRLPGDSIITRPAIKDPDWKVVLRNQQLSFFYKGNLLETYKAIDLPKRP